MGEALAEQQYHILILRLRLDRHGRLAHGEVVDSAARSWGQFTGWWGLGRILWVWLTSRPSTTAP